MPNHGEDEHGGDGRGEIRLHRLDVEEELGILEAEDDGDPQHAHAHQDQHCASAIVLDQ